MDAPALTIDIETEQDIEVLRKVALLQRREITLLTRRVEELSRLQYEQAESLAIEMKRLQDQLDKHTRARFGRRSERRKPRRKPKSKDKTPQSGHGPTPQPTLPVEEQLHDLDEADKCCPACGGDLDEMVGQFDQSEEVDVVERTYRIIRHKRKKYRCSCNGCVETALGPVKLIPGGRYSLTFAVHVAVGKYADHLPLSRQVKAMKRLGLSATSQTLWDQLWALSKVLRPCYLAIHSYILARDIIGADETTWPLMKTDVTEKHWVWSATADDAVFYRIDPSRSAEAAQRLLGNFDGVVVCDGYSSYKALRVRRLKEGADEKQVMRLAGCWAHARRKFFECEDNFPQAAEVLDLIGELYQIEKKFEPGTRAARAGPVLDAIKSWMDAQVVLESSALGGAIGYLRNQWRELTLFLSDERIPLDNNHSERGLRGWVLGRNNHQGSRSERGLEVAALFYTLVETAKLCGVNPNEYLRQAALGALANPGTSLLPHDLKDKT